MRKVITMLLIFISLQNITAQARLGDSFDEIKEEFSQYGIKETICDDGLNALSFKIVDVIVIYYFDKYNICTNTLIATSNKETATKIINHYNSSYIVVDDCTWKVAENLSVAIINRHYDKKLGYIFVWNYLSSELWLQESI